ncbi:MAG: hypothetical protein GKS06_05390 [Acidobacteria bacterium]|nr:hypothetical protein [Acidobacteriota bacterium]
MSVRLATPIRALAFSLVFALGAGAVHGQQANPSAMLQDVVGFYTGTSGTVDDPRAHDLLVEAAATGDVLSRMWLARCYSRGRMLFDRDEEQARAIASELIDQVAELAVADNHEAAFLMGTAYAEGLGVEADQAMAIAWYHRAADLDNVLAQHNLGNAYRAGDGVVRDDGIAVYWYRRAGGQGDALPAFWLGQMYERGEGVTADREEALRWYRDSAGRGNGRAKDALDRLGAR